MKAKLVRENINFQRGGARKTMGLGSYAPGNIKDFEDVEIGDKSWIWHIQNRAPAEFGIIVDKDNIEEWNKDPEIRYSVKPEEKLVRVKGKVFGRPYDIIKKYDTGEEGVVAFWDDVPPENLEESMNFEKGNPRATMGIRAYPLFWEILEHIDEIEGDLDNISLDVEEKFYTIHAVSYWERDEDGFSEPFKLVAESIYNFKTGEVITTCEMENEDVFYHPGSSWSASNENKNEISSTSWESFAEEVNEDINAVAYDMEYGGDNVEDARETMEQFERDSEDNESEYDDE